MPTPRVRIPIDFPPELDEWLRAYAREKGTSRNALIVHIITEFRTAQEAE